MFVKIRQSWVKQTFSIDGFRILLVESGLASRTIPLFTRGGPHT